MKLNCVLSLKRNVHHVYRDPSYDFNILCIVPEHSGRKSFPDWRPDPIFNKTTLAGYAVDHLRKLSALLKMHNQNEISSKSFQAAAMAVGRKLRASVFRSGRRVNMVQEKPYDNVGDCDVADKEMTRSLFLLGQFNRGEIDVEKFQSKRRGEVGQRGPWTVL